MEPSAFLFINIAILISPLRKIKLGSPDSSPEFGDISWFTMMFSAGMGIGILFFSVAEPILHFHTPPPPESGSIDRSAASAIGMTLFHWGLHPWSCYGIVGLCLSYFSHKHNLPLSMRSTFYPLLKEKIHGIRSCSRYTFTVVATLFGLSTSLGLGTMQISAGMQSAMNFPDSVVQRGIILLLVTVLATISVITGIQKGVRFLSNANLLIAFGILCFVFISGPTATYSRQLFSKHLVLPTYSEAADVLERKWES